MVGRIQTPRPPWQSEFRQRPPGETQHLAPNSIPPTSPWSWFRHINFAERLRTNATAIEVSSMQPPQKKRDKKIALCVVLQKWSFLHRNPAIRCRRVHSRPSQGGGQGDPLASVQKKRGGMRTHGREGGLRKAEGGAGGEGGRGAGGRGRGLGEDGRGG